MLSDDKAFVVELLDISFSQFLSTVLHYVQTCYCAYECLTGVPMVWVVRSGRFLNCTWILHRPSSDRDVFVRETLTLHV